MTRSSRNWRSLPGSFDTTHARTRFSSTSRYDIPDLLPQNFTALPPDFRLMPYRTRRPRRSADLCHFYLDDYRFETVW